MRVIYKLPIPSTSFVTDPRLEMLPKRVCTLTCRYEAETYTNINTLTLSFKGVEAFKCTYYMAASVDVIKAYDVVTDFGCSTWLSEITKNLKEAQSDWTGLQHLGIYFDDGPAYEFVCRGFNENIVSEFLAKQ